MSYLSVGLRAILAWILLSSSVDKLRDLAGFQSDLRRYPGLRNALVHPMSMIVPVLELGLAVCFVLGTYWRVAALISALLFGVFAVMLLLRIRSGQRGSCGCGGLLPTDETNWWHFALNVGLASLAGGLAVMTETSVLSPRLAEGVSALPQADDDIGKAMVFLIFSFVLVSLVALLAAVRLMGIIRHRQAIDDIVLKG